MQVLIVVEKVILNKVIINNQIDLIIHLYCLYLNLKKFDLQSMKCLRKFRIINLYNNKLG